MKEAMREKIAAISESVTTWRGVWLRILSRHRCRRKYATEKKRVKKIAFVRYSGRGSASEALGEEADDVEVESLLRRLGWWIAPSCAVGGARWRRSIARAKGLR